MYKEIKKIIERDGEFLILNKRGMVVALPLTEKESFEKIGNLKNIPENPPQSIKELADLGILFFNNYQPKKETTAQYDDALLKSNNELPIYPAPIIAHFSVTNRCDMACKYCSVRNLHHDYQDTDTETCKKIIKKLSDWGVFQIGFTGGEPTLRKDLPELIKYTVSLGNACNLTTNGWALDRQTVETLRRAGLDQAQISLDSCNSEIHDKLRGQHSFERALKAIKLMQENKIVIGIDCVISKNNIETIPDFISFLEKEGVPGLTLIKLKKGDLELETFEKLMPDYDGYSCLIDFLCKRKNINPEVTIDCGSVSNLQQTLTEGELKKLHAAGCPIGQTLISISTTGDLYPCAALASKEFVLGNILQDDPRKIWRENKLLRDLRNIKNKITGRCKQCERLYSCRGGCRGIAYHLSGLFDSDLSCGRIIYN